MVGWVILGKSLGGLGILGGELLAVTTISNTRVNIIMGKHGIREDTRICKSQDQTKNCIVNGYLPPWGVEFYEKVLVLGNFFIEVGVGEDEDTFIDLGGTLDSSEC